MRSRTAYIPLIVAMAAVACKQSGTGGSAPDVEACTKLEAVLCQELGESNPTCASAKTLLEILPPAACETALRDTDYSKKAIAKLRSTCTELMNKLCKDIGEETDSCAMVRRETPKFPPDRCVTMMESYDKVVADLKQREAANQPLSEEQQKALTAGAIGTFGPADAKVTVIEFSDFECPYCSAAAGTVKKLKEKYGDKIRFAFKHFPLSFHKSAQGAAEAAIAAGAQGKFWEYHDVLFANQRALSKEALIKYAEEMKLDMAVFKKALEEETYAKQVKDDIADGEKLGVNGTPTLYVAGKKVSDPRNFDSISKTIDRALEGGT